MFEVRWHGRGGQGSFTGAKLLGVAAALYDGVYAQAFPSFGPERRGAPVLGFNRVSPEPISDHSEIERCDRIVFLDDSLYDERYLADLKEDALILINTRRHIDHPSVRCLDATGLALEVLGRPIANTAMLGFLLAFSEDQISMQACTKAISNDMKPGLAEGNVGLLQKAYAAGRAML
ncbi:MAG: 2-oxoacid:acceptor oxidoreductase family protein [Spirochaetes bacterium]|nr:2-oxoacid:acceptor oxidoreductase family protein [Spirochaetota bacterium]MBU0957145.1 2-oxoacid:acceptor oxidoreductase family protein [Spirochaetota bacterium]